MYIKILSSDLKRAGACGDGLRAFRAAYPKGFKGKWREERRELLLGPMRRYLGWAVKSLSLPTDFGGLDLRGADFRNCDLGRLDLRGANLAGADFRGASLIYTNLNAANLEGANFWGATLIGTRLSNCNLCGAKFDHASIDDASFRSSTVTGASFTCAAFCETDLRGANFTGSNLYCVPKGDCLAAGAIFAEYIDPADVRFARPCAV